MEAKEITNHQGRNIPSAIEPGQFDLLFDYQLEPDEPPFAFKIRFTWDGETAASFEYDAWEDPDEPTFATEANSAPVSGWASWVNGEDVLVAFTQPIADEEGWARVDSGAPGGSLNDSNDGLGDSTTWVSLARLIHAVVMDEPTLQMTRQTY